MTCERLYWKMVSLEKRLYGYTGASSREELLQLDRSSEAFDPLLIAWKKLYEEWKNWDANHPEELEPRGKRPPAA